MWSSLAPQHPDITHVGPAEEASVNVRRRVVVCGGRAPERRLLEALDKRLWVARRALGGAAATAAWAAEQAMSFDQAVAVALDSPANN